VLVCSLHLDLMVRGPTQEDGEKANVLLCWIRDCLREDLVLSVAGCIAVWSRSDESWHWTGTVDASYRVNIP
jgi:hypothetical protein